MKKQISVTDAPAAIGPYSQGIRAGETVYVSGQIPVDPSTKEMQQEISAATARSLENLKAVLAGEGLTLANVVKTTVFLADMADFAAMNEVYARYFEAPFPARSAVQVAKLPLGALLEIEAIAVR